MNKINYISFLQIYAILLVCAGHSFTAVESVYGHEWIYNFHMPLFMFISGFLLAASTAHKNMHLHEIPLSGPNGFIRKKSIRLLLPYLIVSTFTLLPKSLLNQFALRPVDLSFSSWIHMLLWPQDNVIRFFWFLPTLFIISVLTVLISKTGIFRKYQQPYLFCLLLLYIFNPFSRNSFLGLHDVANYMLFFTAGISFHSYESKISNTLKLSSIPTLIILLLAYSLGTWLRLPHPYTLLVTLTGILFSLSLSYIYVRYNQHWLDRYNGSSYTIYLLSWYPCVAIQFLSNQFFLPWYMWAIVSTILQFYLPYIIYRLLLHIKKTSVFGRWFALILGA